jgi:hypothetical protein
MYTTMDDEDFFDDALFEFDSPTRKSPTTRRTPTTPMSMVSTPTSSPIKLDDDGVIYHPDMFTSSSPARHSKVATPKVATPKVATLKVATPKVATPKGATPMQSNVTNKRKRDRSTTATTKRAMIAFTPTTDSQLAHRQRGTKKIRVRQNNDVKYNDTYENSRDKVLAFVEEHKRLPKLHETSDDGLYFLYWLNHQRRRYQKEHVMEAYKDFENNPILKKYMDTTSLQEKTNQIDADYRKYLFDFTNKYKRVPNADDIRASSDAKRALTWLHYQKKKIRSGNQELYDSLAVDPIVKENLDKPILLKIMNPNVSTKKADSLRKRR